MSFMKDYDYLKLEMKDIRSATNNFDPTKVIGRGGFGKVYKGNLFLPEGQITVAFKQLDRRLGQGNTEFWKEIMMLSEYKHENLISLKHFCIEGDEMILAYEYASRGSLDRYLTDASTLTWSQRLKICVGAARGLCFLHDPKETHQRVIHRDIKSANILLDEKWTAKVSDFGLSKVGPANQAHTYLVSNVVGTPGYCDPLYMELGFLTKESDVYSFGVVLFEILCGRLCYEYHGSVMTGILVPKWRRCYEQNRLDEIILPGLKKQMDPASLKSFSAIAYRCLNKVREERPSMAEILEELEFSLKQQVNKWWYPSEIIRRFKEIRLQPIMNLFKGILQPIMNTFKGILQPIMNIFKGILQLLMNIFTWILQLIINIFAWILWILGATFCIGILLVASCCGSGNQEENQAQEASQSRSGDHFHLTVGNVSIRGKMVDKD